MTPRNTNSLKQKWHSAITINYRTTFQKEDHNFENIQLGGAVFIDSILNISQSRQISFTPHGRGENPDKQKAMVTFPSCL